MHSFLQNFSLACDSFVKFWIFYIEFEEFSLPIVQTSLVVDAAVHLTCYVFIIIYFVSQVIACAILKTFYHCFYMSIQKSQFNLRVFFSIYELFQQLS